MMSARVKKPYRTLLTVMFNRRKPRFNQAIRIHLLLMHSFLLLFLLYFTFTYSKFAKN